ncbi:MAG TPA: Xaa-Pro peptidase family protein [Thermoanaerobaculia bacterium]|jgi:Xaa-Pro aminopeptidase
MIANRESRMTARLAALSAGLAELGCEALVVLAPSAQDTDLAPFLPGPAHLGECLLVLPRGGEPRLGYLTPMEREEAAATGLSPLTPEDLEISRLASEYAEPATFLARVLGKALELAGLSPGRVALAGHGAAGTIQGACALLAAQGWTWVPGNALVFASRQRKEPAELAAIREAAEGTCEAMRAVARMLAAASPGDDGVNGVLRLDGEPLTVARLRAEVGRIFTGRGFEQPRGNIIAPGEEGGIPHSAGTPERAVRAGEPLVVDLFPRGRLFADCTRTFCWGEPPAALARAHVLVWSALEEVQRRAAPGVRGWDLQETVCAYFGDAGFPTPISEPGTTHGYVHNLGHGVGFDLHEFPTFKKASGAEGVLREGDVFTIEPGLYEPQQGWGVRLEDLVYLGPDGLETLTPLPYDLDPRAWR